MIKNRSTEPKSLSENEQVLALLAEEQETMAAV